MKPKMKKHEIIMNQHNKNYERIQFKNWIKKRFINEIDIVNIPDEQALLWCQALVELSDEIIYTLYLTRFSEHQIVPFSRPRG